MTPSFYRELRKHFIQVEEKIFSNKQDISNIGYYTVGILNVKTPEQEYSFDFAYTKESEKVSHAAIVLTKNDEYVIIFNFDVLLDIFRSANCNILSVCAHEVGHYLAGHLTEDVSLKNVINYKPENQLFLMSEYRRLETDDAHEAYMNATLHSLLKGGCNAVELEADIVALKFIHLNDLIAIHLETMDENNMFARGEKINRIKQLTKYVNDYDIDQKGYGLELILTKVDGDEMRFSSGSF